MSELNDTPQNNRFSVDTIKNKFVAVSPDKAKARIAENARAGELFTDTALAARAATLLKDDFRFIIKEDKVLVAREFGCWESLDMDVGKVRIRGGIVKVAKDWYDEIYNKYKMLDPKGRDAVTKQVAALQNIGHIEGAAKIFLCDKCLTVTRQQLDADPYLLATKSGVLDLRTGKIVPVPEGAYITRMADVEYDPTATSDDLNELLAHFESQDPDYPAFLARLAGYVSTGLYTEQFAFTFCGDCESGKTTLIEALTGMLGEYAASSRIGLFTKKRGGDNGDGATSGLSRLNGVRLSSIPEVGSDHDIDDNQFKRLCGADMVSGRDLYEKESNFLPTAKFIFASNEDMKLNVTDPGVQRRLAMMPTKRIAANKSRASLKYNLLHDRRTRSALLNFAVRGCQDWIARGGGHKGAVLAMPEGWEKMLDMEIKLRQSPLGFPEVVIKETLDFAIRGDPLNEFLIDEDGVSIQVDWVSLARGTALKSEFSVQKDFLFSIYHAWCGTKHIPESKRMGRTRFYDILRKKKFADKRIKDKQGRQPTLWFGVKALADGKVTDVAPEETT